MPFVEAIWLALAQIRVQKLKSFFTLLGVTIGVMFLIAVISIVQGMSSYMENDFAAKMLGVNTFTLRRFPWFGDGASSEEEWRTWLRRPRIYHTDLALVASVGVMETTRGPLILLNGLLLGRRMAKSPRPA